MEGNHSQSCSQPHSAASRHNSVSETTLSLLTNHPQLAQQPRHHPRSKSKVPCSSSVIFFVLEKNFRSHGADAKSKPAPSQENFNQFLLLLVLMGNYTLESADKVHRFLPADFFIHQCHYTAVQLLIFLSQTNMSLN